MGLVSKIPVSGRHVLLVEDIIDTGKTLQVPFMMTSRLKQSLTHGIQRALFSAQLAASSMCERCACTGNLCADEITGSGQCEHCDTSRQVCAEAS